MAYILFSASHSQMYEIALEQKVLKYLNLNTLKKTSIVSEQRYNKVAKKS